MRKLALIFAFSVVLISLIAPEISRAVTPDEILKDPVLETRARNLSRELRCMVCQNQSIDDSEAPLAKDLRILVRERLTNGDTDKQVLDFLVSRYGEFVLLKPPLQMQTLLLWAVSPGVLLIGIVALFMMARRRTVAIPPPAPLSEAEQRKLSTLVDQ
ncbi:MAG TPA: cytochrome c-type biogenesis protein [Pseudolabrys sp.]|jgi:cytochrome c-type biogenesis protein CcmH